MNKELCNAHAKTTGQPCRNVAGKGTDHVREGKCRFHGGASFFQHGEYSKIKRVPLGQRMTNVGSDLLKLHPELSLLKTLLEDLRIRQQSQKDALEVWHQLVGDAYKTLLHVNDAHEIKDAIDVLRNAASQRPMVAVDTDLIKSMTNLVDKIGHTAERIKRLSGVCTTDQLQYIMDRMAAIVSQHADTATIQKILDGWLNIKVGGQR